ncbi:MAG: glycosyltransferase family 4 protein [Solirubrobacteraceae bacterium]|nr:glycosyltransferase family 4 protein [Solirubrobacteraceae bacterium]
MRLLILTWEYPPIVEGGLARHVCKLAEALARRGNEVHVLTRGDRALPETATQNGVHVHRVPEPSRPRDLDEFVAWIEHMNDDMLAAGRALEAEFSFDVIHGHDWLVARAGKALAKDVGAPWVVTVHATEHGRHQGWVENYPQSHIHGVERWMTHDATRVIACSHYMQEHCAEIFELHADQIDVIPNGIDPTDLRPVPDLDVYRRQFAAPDERLIILAGRLVYEKGFQLALETLPGVIEDLGKVRFVVAGSGTHEDELRDQATKLGLDDHGTFLGWVDDVQLHSLYAVADLCIIPSIYEPFGLVALEAMASGCVCIVADTGGLREIVPETAGLRFTARDPQALRVAIDRALTDAALRSELIDEAREHVRRFDWDEIADHTLALYAGLLGTGTGALATP